MISVEQAEKIVKHTGLHNYEISHKMGMSRKYYLAQMCLYREKKQPFSQHLARMFLNAVGPSSYKGIVSDELFELCQLDYFLSKKQFEKLLKLLNCSHPMLAESLNMNSKVFYMTFRNSDGINFKMTTKLFEHYPFEMSKVLSATQLEIVFEYL